MWQQNILTQGFAIVADVFPRSEMAAFQEEINGAPLQRGRAGARHALRNISVAKLAQDTRVRGIAQQILGDNARPFRATLFDKSPGSNWLVVWHQDTAL